jgi:hypothetical protein
MVIIKEDIEISEKTCSCMIHHARDKHLINQVTTVYGAISKPQLFSEISIVCPNSYPSNATLCMGAGQPEGRMSGFPAFSLSGYPGPAQILL